MTAYPEIRELSGGGFVLKSPAKVNLSLQIFGKRGDGYHELDTLFQEIDWCDELSFKPSSIWTFAVTGKPELANEDNLISRASRLLAEASGHSRVGNVSLRKVLPVGGGLGGGSSNGTIALLGLSRLWGINWTVDQLSPLAAQLGSDTNFFLHGGLARGRGRGERIELLPGACSSSLLVVVPHFGISTSWVFENAQFPLTDSSKSVIFQSRVNLNVTSDRWVEGLFNDLENITLRKHPELAQLKSYLLLSGARAALLSGSGSCMFGIFRDDSLAERAARGLDSRFSWRVCRGVSRR